MALSHDTHGDDCASPDPVPEPAHAFQVATAFWERFTLAIRIDDPTHVRLAWFDLHQSAEFALKSIVLAMTHGTPECHDLRLLSRLAARYIARVADAFPDRESLTLLDRAYLAARYDARWSVSRDQLIGLAPAVQRLIREADDVVQAAAQSAFDRSHQ